MEGADVTADSLIADYANNVIEDFRRVEMERSRGGGRRERMEWLQRGSCA